MSFLLLDYLKEHIVMVLAKIRWGKKAILLSFKYVNWEKCNCINVIAFIKTSEPFLFSRALCRKLLHEA